jgi:hypothetical protein
MNRTKTSFLISLSALTLLVSACSAGPAGESAAPDAPGSNGKTADGGSSVALPDADTLAAGCNEYMSIYEGASVIEAAEFVDQQALSDMTKAASTVPFCIFSWQAAGGVPTTTVGYLVPSKDYFEPLEVLNSDAAYDNGNRPAGSGNRYQMTAQNFLNTGPNGDIFKTMAAGYVTLWLEMNHCFPNPDSLICEAPH